MSLNICDSIKKLKNIGKSREFLLNKAGVFNIRDLLFFFPKKHLFLTDSIAEGEIFCLVKTINKKYFSKFVKIIVNFKGKEFVINLFNKKLAFVFKIDCEIKILGIFIENKIESVKVINSEVSFLPIYKTLFSSLILHKIINELILKIEPEVIFENMKFNEALYNIHNGIEIEKSFKALKFLEASLLVCLFKNEIKHEKKLINDELLNNLPFKPSENQLQVIKNIKNELQAQLPMKCFIFGEVGSGKTLIALASILMMIKDFNIVFLAPTLTLANQHANFIFPILEKLEIKCILYTSEIKKKKKIKQQIEEGEFQLIIGTHALLYTEKINNLGLIIIDEIQKFGVLQRAQLLKKAVRKNLLLLSATPPPRSLSILMKNFVKYFQLESFYEKKISTIVILKNKISLLLEKLKNKKAYWVMSSIEEFENMIGVINRFEYIKNLSFNVDFLHGKMKDEEKKAKIENFKKMKNMILVSTSIIEVGIDVPDADIIVIEDSIRFGLAQLHQLRGRVGRSGQQAYCFLLTDHYSKKLNLLKNNQDGIAISKLDMCLRGEGSLTGVEQHGFSSFRFLNKENDQNIIEEAMEKKYEFKAFEFFVNENNIVH